VFSTFFSECDEYRPFKQFVIASFNHKLFVAVWLAIPCRQTLKRNPLIIGENTMGNGVVN